MVAAIRSKLADPAIRKGADADDLAALEAFYAARVDGPLWSTEMGFSAKGQAAIFEIEKADEWGLDAKAFALPSAAELPESAEAQALAEIKLDLAILKYARFARGGRLVPSKVSELFDQTPPLRDPKLVLTEIEAAEAPDQYLQSLHPKHEQFQRLRQALLQARGGEGGAEGEDAKPAASDKDRKRLVINMERWRWMPEDLGSLHVWNNSPAFMLYVVKDGKTVYADKTLVGTINYATPVFTADMKTIVFNPDWNAPETVVKENIVPHLQQRNYSILRAHKLFVSYNGTPVDAAKVDWKRVNPLAYTFSQRAGPHNNLGKVKFLYPNRHTVYMHDTLPVRKKYFKQTSRLIGHECVRMEKPQKFAEVLLAEDKGWTAARIQELWDKGVNSSVSVEKKIPVHMVYFTTVVDESGKVDISPMSTAWTASSPSRCSAMPRVFPRRRPSRRSPWPARPTPRRRPRAAAGPTTTLRGQWGWATSARLPHFLACAASHPLMASSSMASKRPSVVNSVMPLPKPSASERQGDFLEKAMNISAVTTA